MQSNPSSLPFVLKFNRWTMESYICLKFWLSLVANTGRKCFLLQDLWINSGNFPKEFQALVESMNLQLIVRSTNYEKHRNLKFVKPESKRWALAAAANLTAFELTQEDYFWLIDADDTIFLTEPKQILEKLCLAEELAMLKSLDGFSYAFYRHVWLNHWSLGIALMKTRIPLDIVADVHAADIEKLHISDNIDGAFDLLRRNGILNLQSFIFNDIVFHHHTPKITAWNTGAVFGVYDWRDSILNGVIKAPDDVIAL
jgi:hypothetical protein